MLISLYIYLGIGALMSIYVWISYFVAIGKLVKEHCTEKYPRPTKMPLYFGFYLWGFSDNDPLLEIIIVVFLVTAMVSLLLFGLWPLTFFFILNYAIKEARRKNFGEK